MPSPIALAYSRDKQCGDNNLQYMLISIAAQTGPQGIVCVAGKASDVQVNAACSHPTYKKEACRAWTLNDQTEKFHLLLNEDQSE